MQESEERLQLLSNRYTKLAIGSIFLMALLQGVHSFFFTLFFWPALGFGILAIYYRRAAKQEERSRTVQWQRGSATNAKTNIIRTIVIGVALISLLTIILSVAFSKKNDPSSTSETRKTEKTEDENSETKSSDYESALQEFNNQNYRSSISIGRKALANDPENKDLMLVLGDDYGALKQNDSSLIWFDRAYQKGARSAYLSHWLGYLYDDKGNISQAIQFYKDALKQDSSRTQLYDRLAELEPEKADEYKKKSAKWVKSE